MPEPITFDQEILFKDLNMIAHSITDYYIKPDNIKVSDIDVSGLDDNLRKNLFSMIGDKLIDDSRYSEKAMEAYEIAGEEALIVLGFEQLRNKELDNAIQTYKRAGETLDFSKLMDMYIREKNPNMVIKIHEKTGEATREQFIEIGKIHVMDGNADEAEKIFDEIGYNEGFMSIGHLRASKNEFFYAVKAYQRAGADNLANFYKQFLSEQQLKRL